MEMCGDVFCHLVAMQSFTTKPKPDSAGSLYIAGISIVVQNDIYPSRASLCTSVSALNTCSSKGGGVAFLQCIVTSKKFFFAYFLQLMQQMMLILEIPEHPSTTITKPYSE